VTTTFTQGVQNSLQPLADPAGNWQAYNATLGGMFDQVWGIVSDQGSPDAVGYTAGWSTLLDPDNCPTQFLPYLGMFVGVYIPPGTADATARSLIKNEAGWARGTAAAIVAAAQRNLIGTQSVSLLERTPDPYSFNLVVRPEECQNPAALTAAVNAVKPAGVVWTLVLTDTWDIFQMEASQGTLSALEGNFATITGLEQDQVGH
jgi:hypothetical protein